MFISQPEEGQCKVPKHVVVLYVINSIYIYIYIYHHIVRQIRTLQSSLIINTTGMTNLMRDYESWSHDMTDALFVAGIM